MQETISAHISIAIIDKVLVTLDNSVKKVVVDEFGQSSSTPTALPRRCDGVTDLATSICRDGLLERHRGKDLLRLMQQCR